MVNLWPIFRSYFELNLDFATTGKAFERWFFRDRKIGICDISEEVRSQIDSASIWVGFCLRDLVCLSRTVFQGGPFVYWADSNGPDIFRILKELRATELISNEVPTIHNFRLGYRKKFI